MFPNTCKYEKLQLLSKTVKARAPLRLGLAGGGTDIFPYCDLYGGIVLNATIDLYAYTTINILDSSMIRFIASDYSIVVELNTIFPLLKNRKLPLHSAVYNYFIRTFNNGIPISLELITYCDVKSGSGLGSSSALVVSMLRAFIELFNLPINNYEIAYKAFEIERIDCCFKGGKQDQYAAVFGGFNFIQFYKKEHTLVNTLNIKESIKCKFEESLLLFFTGIPRNSERIIADQCENIINQDYISTNALHALKQEALIMKKSLLKGDFQGIIHSMRTSWKRKKQSSHIISNSYIEKIYATAIQAGALAGKVSGAGGGGFMLFYVPIKSRLSLIKALTPFKGEISNVHFTLEGTQAFNIIDENYY